jgi:hypothetical protein
MSVDFPDLRTPEALRPHAVEVSYTTLQRLRQLVIPAGDSIDDVIAHLLNIYEAREPQAESAPPGAKNAAARVYDPLDPPDLTHAMVLSARINGVALAKGTSWSGIHRAVLRSSPGGNAETPVFVTPPQTPNAAWTESVRSARHHGIALDVEFVWRRRAPVAVRGERGRLTF